jgi:predicted RNase H-like nuclease (RuvC/YqgF family)
MKKTNSIIKAVNETKADLVKPKRKYTKRKVNAVAKPEVSQLGKYARELEVKLTAMTTRVAHLEYALTEKEKEVWNLECEVFDKKAVIKYLEEKLFQKGVRV